MNRDRKRNIQANGEKITPRLWAISPTLAASTLNKFGAVNDVNIWGKGVYLLPEHLQLGIIVVHQLPEIPETLWFRLVGKGKVQQRAVAEMAALPVEHAFRGNALDLFLSLKLELEAKQTIEPEERELLMQLSPLLIEKIEAAEQRGRQAGESELLLRLLNRRVGTLSPELQVQIRSLSLTRLEELGEALLDFTSLVDLEIWLDRT